MRKVTVSFVFLLAAVSTTLFAQSKDLVITGSVASVKISGIGSVVRIDPKNEWAGHRYERSETWFEIDLHLTYCNRGDVSVIVPSRRVFPNQMTKLLFLDLPSSSGSPAKTVIGKLFPGSDRNFGERFIDILKGSTPPFQIIDPDKCFESFDRLLVDSGFTVDVRSRGLNKPDVEFARPEHPYFKLQYGFSMKDPLPVAEAKTRWSKFGRLVTSADGDFFFETDVIINKLTD